MSEARDFLETIITDFSVDKFKYFFRKISKHYRPIEKNIPQFNDDNFKKGFNIGEVDFPDHNNLLIVSFESINNLSERAGKKLQFNLAKSVLKQLSNYTAGIFIFYDQDNNFRFSLIYPEFKGNTREWSNFKRFNYFISNTQTNKTFLQRVGDADFSSLDKIKEAFSVDKVTEEFYKEIANWYFWALKYCKFPKNAEEEDGGRNVSLIRLITRIIFIWFMRERDLVPKKLFLENEIKNILNNLSPESSTYYLAILQNLFFATLSTKQDERKFRSDARGHHGVNPDFGNQNVYRYHELFNYPENIKSYFSEISFLNGGLFDCFDDKSKNIYIDGFTDVKKNQPDVPNKLFFSKEVKADLNKIYGTKNKKYKVKGLLNILSEFNFTTDENSLDDQEVALDPELLGRVFENLLASYNPETSETARKSTGSFYTPREIVDYMVTESLKQYFKTHLLEVKDIDEKLSKLLSTANEEIPFDKIEIKQIVSLVDAVRIIDPAVGSGAFPMGILLKLVLILHKLDPRNVLWKQKHLDKVSQIDDQVIKENAIADIESAFENNELDYGRKLYLIENCIYGVDIQPIAIQISKLRVFISLLIDQNKQNDKENFGIRSLPNLESKFVAANSLIGLEIPTIDLFSGDNPIKKLQDDLKNVRHLYFNAKTKKDKIKFQNQDKKLRKEMSEIIKTLLSKRNEVEIVKIQTDIEKAKLDLQRLEVGPEQIEIIETTNLFGEKEIKKINKKEEKIKAQKYSIKIIERILKSKQNVLNKETMLQVADNIATFDLYDQNHFANWFEPEWMFGLTEGFDVVIGNPPYGADIDDYIKLFEELYPKTSKGFKDIFKYFFNCSLSKLTSKNGVLCFITPNTFFLQPRYGDLRKYLLEYNIHSLINLGEDVFEAVVPTAISIINGSKANAKNKIKFADISDASKYSGSIEQLNFKLMEQQQFNETPNNIFTENIRIKKEDEEILENVLDFKDAGINYQRVNVGLSDKGNSDLSERLLYEGEKERETHFEYWKGTDINAFYIAPETNRFVRPNIRLRENERVILNEDYFSHTPKLLWRQTASVPIAVVDRIGIWFGRSIQAGVIKNTFEKKMSYEYLCCLLNSTYIRKIYEQSVNEGGRVFPQVKLEKLRPLPIKIIALDKQKHFIDLAKKIESLKRKNANADITELEKQLDEMVYKLYELTEEEIKIVRGK